MWFILAVFFVVADIAYVVWTLLYDSQNLATDPSSGGHWATRIEWVGTTALALTAVLALLIGFYLRRVHASIGMLPEDINEAEIDDGDAEQGFFSPFSWWPITLALGAATVFTGLAVGPWIIAIGVPIVVIALIGWVYEYFRGNFAR